MAKPAEKRREGRPSGTAERSAPFSLRADDDDDDLNDGFTLDGYGAVFNRTTVIDDWEGIYREQIAPGSMRKSFRESPPIIQFDHGRHPLIGSFPIAELKSITEDSDPELAPEGGAHIIGRMYDHLFFEPLRHAIATKQVKGMSFRFSVVREVWHTADGKQIKDDEELLRELRRTWGGDLAEEELPIRTLKEVKVPEMGPVVWPAYQQTSVGMRSIDLDQLEHDADARIAVVRKLFAVPDLGKVQSQSRGDDAPQTTTSSGPQRLRDGLAGAHPSLPNGAPQTTGEKPAGEHPLNSRESSSGTKRAIDLMVEKSRDVLLQIHSKER